MVPGERIANLVVVVPAILRKIRRAADGRVAADLGIGQAEIVGVARLREVGATGQAGIPGADRAIVFLHARLLQALEAETQIVDQRGADHAVVGDVDQRRNLVGEAAELGQNIGGAERVGGLESGILE